MLNKISVNIIWVTYSHQKLITFEKLSSLKYLPMTYFCPYDENMLMQSCNIYKKTKKQKKEIEKKAIKDMAEVTVESSVCSFFVHFFFSDRVSTHYVYFLFILFFSELC